MTEHNHPNHPIVGRVRLRRPVASEYVLVAAGVGTAAEAGEHPITMNQNGAVSIVQADGGLFGVKPSEFEFIEITAPLTNRQIGAWLMLDVDLRFHMNDRCDNCSLLRELHAQYHDALRETIDVRVALGVDIDAPVSAVLEAIAPVRKL